MSGSGAGSPGGGGDIDGSMGFHGQGRQEIFHHHTYDLIKKKDEEIKKLQDELKDAYVYGEKWFGKAQELEKELEQQRFNNKHNLSIDQKVSDEIQTLKAESNKKMRSLTEWLHESIKGDMLEVVLITDLNKTVLGLKDTKSRETFIVGNMHDLTFILEGNDRR
jgi:hypothetical protein